MTLLGGSYTGANIKAVFNWLYTVRQWDRYRVLQNVFLIAKTMHLADNLIPY